MDNVKQGNFEDIEILRKDIWLCEHFNIAETYLIEKYGTSDIESLKAIAALT